jgi:hypothetical protein
VTAGIDALILMYEFDLFRQITDVIGEHYKLLSLFARSLVGPALARAARNRLDDRHG